MLTPPTGFRRVVLVPSKTRFMARSSFVKFFRKWLAGKPIGTGNVPGFSSRVLYR